ncbi:MAG: hypothetical protein ACFFBH_17530 [Promethearchaeota archaeon]
MTEEKSQDFKKHLVNYFDIILAFINSLVIIFPLIIIYENLAISIIGIFLSCGTIALAIFTFIRNNPLYIYYCYSLLLCALLFSIPSIMLNPYFAIILIPDICFIYNLSKGKSQTSALSSYAKAQFLMRMGTQYGMSTKKLSQQWDNINPELELKKQQQREILEKQYYSKKIIISTFILSVSLVAIFALFAANFVSS